MASKKQALNKAYEKVSKWKKSNQGKKNYQQHALKNSGGSVNPDSPKDKAKKAMSKSPIAKQAGKAASSTGKTKAPAKKFVRNRPNIGGKKPAAKPTSATSKYGTGTMVGGRQKFGKGLNKKSKWNSIVGRGNKQRDLNGNQWHSKKDLGIIQKVINDHAAEFYGKDGNGGIYKKLLNNPDAYNKTAHTLNLAADPTVKGWIDDAIKQNSSHTKRFAENFKESRFNAHDRTSPKAMKRRAKALFYTVQFGPDGKAK